MVIKYFTTLDMCHMVQHSYVDNAAPLQIWDSGLQLSKTGQLRTVQVTRVQSCSLYLAIPHCRSHDGCDQTVNCSDSFTSIMHL